MSDNGVREGKISELTPDRRNANKGTQAGLRALDQSLRQLGAGRSILIDKDGEIIAGNKTTERAADLGLEDVIIVQTDGTKLVAVQRTDLDLDTDPEARQLAYADNRIAELDLEWDYEQVDFDLEQGVDLEWLAMGGEIDYDEHWQGMPEFETDNLTPVQTIKVNFSTVEDVYKFAELVNQKLTEDTRSIWYPEAEKLSQTNKVYEDES